MIASSRKLDLFEFTFSALLFLLINEAIEMLATIPMAKNAVKWCDSTNATDITENRRVVFQLCFSKKIRIREI